MDKIIRQFVVNRGGRDILYPFTTYPCVLGDHDDVKSELRPLFKYLRQVFIKGVPTGERRSVTDCEEIIIHTSKIQYPELTEMARRADYRGFTKYQHTRVQGYFMENDPHTLAIEIPVFDGETLGHIDILRVLPSGSIEILDFKPLAHKESKAASQLFRYAQCLSKSLQCPMEKLKAYYFDDKNIYQITL